MIEFNTVEEALEDLRRGRIILVTDDQDRENEGDFICAAEFATTENVNFMASVGKGFVFRRWWKIIRTIMRLHLPCRSIINQQRPGYRQRNGQ